MIRQSPNDLARVRAAQAKLEKISDATGASPGDRDGEMRLAGAGSADQHAVALMLEEVATG